MNDSPDQMIIVSNKKLDELNQKIELVIEMLNAKKNESQPLGDYITENEARTILSRKTTWFYEKRKSKELPGKKMGGTWYYKRSDILNIIEKGKSNC